MSNSQAAIADAAYEKHRARLSDNSERIYMDRRQKGALFGKLKTGGKGHCLRKNVLFKKLNANDGKLAKYIARIAGRDIRPELQDDIDGKLSVGQFISLIEFGQGPKTGTLSTPAPISVIEVGSKKKLLPKPSKVVSSALEQQDILTAMQVLLPAAQEVIAAKVRTAVTKNVKPRQWKPTQAENTTNDHIKSMDALEVELSLVELQTLLPYVRRPFNQRVITGAIALLKESERHPSVLHRITKQSSMKCDNLSKSRINPSIYKMDINKVTALSDQMKRNKHKVSMRKTTKWQPRAVRRAKKAAANAIEKALTAKIATGDNAISDTFTKTSQKSDHDSVANQSTSSLFPPKFPASKQRSQSVDKDTENGVYNLQDSHGLLEISERKSVNATTLENDGESTNKSCNIVADTNDEQHHNSVEADTDCGKTLTDDTIDHKKTTYNETDDTIKENIAQSHDSISESKHASQQKETYFCCRMCRAPLFCLDKVSHGGEQNSSCDSLFLEEPEKWMNLVQDGSQKQVC